MDELLQTLQSTVKSTLQGGKILETWKEDNVKLIPRE